MNIISALGKAVYYSTIGLAVFLLVVLLILQGAGIMQWTGVI